MKNTLVIFVFSICTVTAFSQIGFGGGYKSMSAAEWMDEANALTGKVFSNPSGYQLFVDYRLRTKEIRIEIYPTLSYNSLKNDQSSVSLKYSQLGFHLNTNVYPFDLEGDCDCPTWSKSGNVFQKGFFLQVSPGINNMGISFSGFDGLQSDRFFFWDIGLGAGLDVGVSEMLTVSPMVRYNYAPGAKWQYMLAPETEEREVKSKAGHFFAGVRIGVQLRR